MAQEAAKAKSTHPKAEVNVFDHSTKQPGTMTNFAYQQLKDETFSGEDGRKYMRYTLGKSKVPAPTKKKAED